jgi:uncharacterized protein (TIGR02118 family)
MSDKTKDASTNHSRRDVVIGTGAALAMGMAATVVASSAPPRAQAFDSPVGSRCMTILYPNSDDVRFDFEYYKNHHMPLIMRLYTTSIAKFELRKGLPGPDGSKPPYVATVNIWIADQEAFAKNGEQHGQTLIDDVPNFSSVMPVVQADEIYEIAVS